MVFEVTWSSTAGTVGQFVGKGEPQGKHGGTIGALNSAKDYIGTEGSLGAL